MVRSLAEIEDKNQHKIGFPSPQEFEAINVAVTEACDGLDGLKDGIISLPQDCTFDPMTVVGKQYICPSTNQSMTVTTTLATVAKMIWQGATTTEGDFLWYAGNIGASFAGLASTTCKNNNTCVGVPFAVPQTWVTDFVLLDREYDTARLNIRYFEQLFHEAVDRYDAVIGTANPNLDGFRKAGGKLLSWHGLADQAIAPDATAHYAQQVHKRDSNASDYYRYFEAPGVDHCGGGLGWYPGDGLEALIDWVEKGVAPETLKAETTTGRKAELCLWPKHLVYVAGNPDEAVSFECR
jgi:feruloyl esterase